MEAETQEMKWQLDTAVSHAVILRRDYSALKRQMNAKEAQRKRPGRGLRVHGLMMSDAARQKFAEEDAKRAGKKQKAGAAKQRKLEKEVARRAQRDALINGTEIFKGRLSGKSKAELEDIATALSLSADGTKAEIVQRIKEHLDSTPDLRHSQRFSGLYPMRGPRVHDVDHHSHSMAQNDDVAPIAGPRRSIPHHSNISCR